MKKIILFVILFICGFMLCNAVAHEQGQYIQVGDDYLGTAAILDKADTVTDTNTLPTGAAILAWGGGAGDGTGYWSQTGSDIYYDTGKVAIGHDTFAGDDQVYIYTTYTDNQSKALKVFHNGSVTGTGYAGWFRATGAGSTSNVALYATASGGTYNYAAIFQAGSVGIGTTTPDTALEVVGVITATAGTSTNWNTAYTDRLKWDGEAGSLIAATGLTSLGLDGVASAVTSGAYLIGLYDEFEFSNADNLQDFCADIDYAISTPTAASEVKTGRIRYNSTTGRTVTFALPPLADTDYDVFITNWSSNVNAGIPSIESKATTGFTLKASGSSTSALLEYYAIPYTLRGSTQQQGTDTFNSTTGVTVALVPNLDDTDYDVIISLSTQTNIEDIGEISVESKAVDEFIVKNSGPDTTSGFRWLAVPYELGAIIDPSGSDTFAGSGGQTIAIGEDVGSTAYVVLITSATQVDLIDVGVVSIENKSQTQFDVMNSGSGTSNFEWRVFPQVAGSADMYRTVYDADLDSLIDHEAGGFNADVSAYAGLLKISGGATSYITDSSTDWDTAYTHSQETTGAVHGATTNNTGNKIVRRDASGDFAAGTITAALTGNATTASHASDLVIGSQAQGDVLYFDGSDWARLGVGTSGKFLKTQGAAANPKWDSITAITVVDTADTTTWVALWTDATGAALAPKSDGALTYNAGTGKLSATGFIGGLTGNVTGDVTGNVTGSSGSTTGNAATATRLANARLIGGVSFTGLADIVPQTIQVTPETIDATCYVAFFKGAAGSYQPKTHAGLTFDSTTGKLTAITLTDGTASMASGALTAVTSLTFTGANAVPNASGELQYDSTISGMSGGGLRWRDNNSDRLLVDLETDPSTDDYVVAYDAAADGFYMKEDAEGEGVTYTAGSGIGLSGTTFFVHAGAGLSQEADGLRIGAGLVTSTMMTSTWSAGVYTNANITVDDAGRITAAEDGTGGGAAGGWTDGGPYIYPNNWTGLLIYDSGRLTMGSGNQLWVYDDDAVSYTPIGQGAPTYYNQLVKNFSLNGAYHETTMLIEGKTSGSNAKNKVALMTTMEVTAGTNQAWSFNPLLLVGASWAPSTANYATAVEIDLNNHCSHGNANTIGLQVTGSSTVAPDVAIAISQQSAHWKHGIALSDISTNGIWYTDSSPPTYGIRFEHPCGGADISSAGTLTFQDGVTGKKTLAQLAAGGGGLTNVFDAGTYGSGGAAIQTAIDYAEAAGGMVYIPPGVWNITSNLTVTKSMVIFGAGTSAEETSAGTILSVSAARGFSISTRSGVTIRDMRIIVGAGNTGIYVTGPDVGNENSKFQNLYITGGSYGIYFYAAGVWNITDCEIRDGSIACVYISNHIWGDWGDSGITSTVIWATGAGAHGVLHVSGGGLRIIGSKLCSNSNTGVAYKLDWEGNTNSGVIQITGNSFEGNPRASIQLLNTSAYYIYTMQITGNELLHGIEISGTNDTKFLDIVITGNHIFSTGPINAAISIDHCNYINIVGNVIRSNGGAYGIVVNAGQVWEGANSFHGFASAAYATAGSFRGQLTY